VYKIRFKCKIITPMFMSSLVKEQPELRPSEFKGMIRFWWRAIKANNDIEKLAKEETEIFGSADKDIGKSKILIRIKRLKICTGNHLKKDYKFNWYFNKNFRKLDKKHRGIGYLFYSTVRNCARKYIKPESLFIIEFLSRDKEKLEKAVASFWASVYLGGFGTRARRGGGNITIIQVENSKNLNIPEFIINGNNSQEIADCLIDNYKKAKKVIAGTENYPQNFVTTYSNLSFSRFIISKDGKVNWFDALNEVGEIFHDFRYKHRNKIFDSAVFGLPVSHRSNGFVKSVQNNRRSSPLIFKILEVDSKYYWMVLRLSGEFLPQGDILKSNNQTQKPDYILIDTFWKELFNKIFEKKIDHILNYPSTLSEIINDIKKELTPRRIILFGSRARGDAHKRADIDIAVNTDKNISELELNAPVDIVDLKTASSFLKQQIEREGVTLYERKT